MNNRTFLVAGLMLGFSLSSCSLIDQADRIILPDWQPEFAFPLVNSEISAADLLDQLPDTSLVAVDADGLIRLSWRSDAVELSAAGLMSLDDIAVPLPVSSVSFRVDGQQTALARLSGGELRFAFRLPEAAETRVQFSVPAVSRAGTGLVLEWAGSAGDAQELTADLAGYELDLSGELAFSYTAIRQGDQAPLRLEDCSVRMERMRMSYAEGYLGQVLLPALADSLELDRFEAFRPGLLDIAAPSLTLHIRNSFGIPVKVSAASLGCDTRRAGTVSLLGGELAEGILLPYPPLSEPGGARSASVRIHPGNSSLREAIAADPLRMFWNLGALLHPSGNPEEYGFVTDSSRLSIAAELDIPLELRFADLRIEEVLPVSMPEAGLPGDAVLRLITENGFPLELSAQLYFEDETGAVLDSLFEGPAMLLAAGAADASGRVQTPSQRITDLPLTQARADRIRTASQVRVSAVAGSGPEERPLKWYADDRIRVRLGVRISPEFGE
ncbi:MAG: hypothetical protein NW241_08980 [Bacteroidia bacterium]|nr:hypothetical protein [Bacteroidia bacterium]